jgi:PAS domain S-box-containing protein
VKGLFHVLLVEDSANDAELIILQLQQSDMRFSHAVVKTLEDMKLRLKSEDIDIVLCDFNLTSFNAMDVLEYTHQHYPNLPIIIVTGSLSDETAISCIKKGAWDYVVKQHLKQLPNAVKNALKLRDEQADKKQMQDSLNSMRWLLEIDQIRETRKEYTPYYGNVVSLNTDGEILKTMGTKLLNDLSTDVMDLLDTSLAVYEKNGDYAFGLFLSSWCQFMDESSRRLCATDDNREALSCGKWLCHDNCWNQSAKAAMLQRSATDIACVGGIHLYCEPIFAGDEVIGAINIGYGNPPLDTEKLNSLATRYNVDVRSLAEHAQNYNPRPPFIIEVAKRRVKTIARLIGETVYNARAKKQQSVLEERYQFLANNINDVLWIYSLKQNHYLYLSPSAEKMFGINPRKPEQYRLEDHIVPEFLASCKAQIDDLCQWNADHPMELTRQCMQKRADGSSFWTEVSLTIVPDEDGQIDRMMGITRDITTRRQQEQELKTSNERYQLLSSATFEGIVLHQQGIVLDANQSFLDMMGWSYGEALGKNLFDSISHTKDKVRILEKIKQDHALPYTVSITRADGSSFSAELEAKNIVYDGTEIRIVAVRDVTKREAIGQALRESEAKYFSVVNEMSEGIFVMQGYKCVFANTAIQDISGYSLEAIHQMDFTTITHTEDIAKVKAIYEQRLRGAEIAPYDMRIVKKDGSIRWIKLKASQILWEGKPAALYFATDITEEKKMVQQLQESEVKYRNIVDYAPIGFMQTKPDGTLITANKRLAEMLGYDSEDALLQHNSTDFYHDKQVRETIITEHLASADEDHQSVECQWVRKDGSPFWVMITAHFNTRSEPSESYFDAFVIDITKAHEAQEFIQKKTNSIKAQSKTIAQLAINPIVTQGQLTSAGQLLTETACKILQVQRASIWLFNDDNSALVCKTLYDSVNPQSQSSSSLSIDAYPAYFSALKQHNIIAVHNTATASETIELRESYLVPLGISSLLDVGIRLNGMMVGVFSIEHVGPPRTWHPEEESFANNLASLASQTLINEKRRRAKQELRDSEEKFRVLAETSPMAIMLYQENKWIYANQAAEDICGYTRSELATMQFWEFVAPEHQAMVKERGTMRAQGGKAPSNYEFKIITKQGVEKWVLLNGSSVSIQGKPSGFITVLDISSRKRAEEIRRILYLVSSAVNETTTLEEYYAVLHKHLNMVINAENFFVAMYDPKNDMMHFPYLADEFDTVTVIPAKDSFSKYVMDTGTSLHAPREVREELERRGLAKMMGTPAEDWVGVPLKDKDTILGLLAVYSYSTAQHYTSDDIEVIEFVAKEVVKSIKQHRLNDEIRKNLKTKETLLQEIHHRVKNNLQIISSLLKLQSSYLEDPTIKDVFKQSENRVKSMALIHQKLYESEDLSNISIQRYILDLSSHLMASYHIYPNKITLDCQVEELRFSLKYAVPLALLINECITNSIKYAFPDDRTGTIFIRFSHLDANRYRLIIGDTGIGLPADISPETTDTFGMRLIYLQCIQINGELQVKRQKGVSYQIDFAVTDGV